ncbi:MAG: succinylglutamate desuccinylase/aspartoacylase family protein [Planctomycetes bacterium]|nr:succinylglutamate desuccinylase/aspartoacylase family protein [Planctomycetota bacterium]
MKRILAQPERVDWDSPGRRDYFVRFEHPTAWGECLVPVTILVGPEASADRGLVAIGSTHGNEYEGPVAIKHLLAEMDERHVRGRIILIPVLNVCAFKAGTRDTPEDGVNLNRAFPGHARGSITFRLADFVHRYIFPRVHVVIDLHSGGLQMRFTPCTSFHRVPDEDQQKAMMETARDFGCRFTMMYQDLTAGLLTSTAERLGRITIGSELGWGQAVSAEGVSMGKQGILAAAVRQGLLRGDLPPNRHCPRSEQVLVDNSDLDCYVLSPFEGHFEPAVPCGGWVAKEQLIGWVHDFDRIDDPPVELKSPHDGFVLCQAWQATVFRGEVVSVVSRRRDWPAS